MAITSIAGVFIRPRKKKNQGKRSFTLRFILTGAIPSKKNNQIPVSLWQDADRRADFYFNQGKGVITREQYNEIRSLVRPVIIPSNRFQKWHTGALESIVKQRERWLVHLQKRSMLFPLTNCSISIYWYWKDNKVRDNTNKADSIHDLLRDANIISNDAWQSLSPTSQDADLYKDEITNHTTVIDLTTYY